MDLGSFTRVSGALRVSDILVDNAKKGIGEIDTTIHILNRYMKEGNPNPITLEDWAKIGVPGGEEELRQAHAAARAPQAAPQAPVAVMVATNE